MNYELMIKGLRIHKEKKMQVSEFHTLNLEFYLNGLGNGKRGSRLSGKKYM